MRRCLALLMVLSCVPAHIAAQTSPLWSEQKVKNFQPVPFDRRGGVGETSLALYLFPSLVQMEKAEKATLSVPPGLASLPPVVATGDRAATLVFLAEALKPKATGKGTSTAELSTTGVWSERDPREATAAQGKRATDAFVDAAVRFIERWKQLRPMQRP